MRTTIILTDTEDTNLARSLASLLESTTTPTNICMLFDNKSTENKWATAKAIMGGCCGSAPPEEVVENDFSIVTNRKYDINISAIKFNARKSGPQLKNFAVGKFRNETDVFFTLSSGVAYGNNLIEKYLLKFNNPLVKAVYSDYYDSGKKIYLQSFSPMMTSKIETREIAFRSDCYALFNTDNFSFLAEVYTTGIISHIPEFLFSV